MTTLREAAQQALEALEGWENHDRWVWPESALEQAKRNTTEALAALRAALAEQVQESSDMAEQLADALDSAQFYRRRCEAIQAWQSKMRDPERVIVCDILANGKTLDPAVAGDRYTVPRPAEPVQEPVVQISANRVIAAIEEWKSLWWKVPPFASKVNRATREAITVSHNPLFALLLDAQAAKQMPKGCTTPSGCQQHGCHGECLPTEPPRPAEPFSPESISTTQAAWKMGYEARKAEEQADPDSPERRCGGPGCDMTCCQPVQEPQGCDHCNHPLYAAIKCRVCGRAHKIGGQP